MRTQQLSKQNLGVPKWMLAGMGAMVALSIAMLVAGDARAEVLTPHVARPEAVATHEASAPAVPDPAAVVGLEENGSSADGPALDTPAPPIAPAADTPVADSPSGDGPKPNPAPGPCKPKPGHICPYFCPHNSLLSSCTEPPQLIPNHLVDKEHFSSMEEFARTLHLCAANRPVAFMVGVYVDLAHAFQIADGLQEFFELSERSGLTDISMWEAYNADRLNCQDFVEL